MGCSVQGWAGPKPETWMFFHFFHVGAYFIPLLVQDTTLLVATQVSLEQGSQEEQASFLCHDQVAPDYRVCPEKAENSTLVLVVDVKASRHCIRL